MLEDVPISVVEAFKNIVDNFLPGGQYPYFVPDSWVIDRGSEVHVFGRPASGRYDYIELEPRFEAGFTVSRYRDTSDTTPDFATISVGFNFPKNYGSVDLFSRQFAASQLSDTFLHSTIHDIVQYDPDSRVVSFNVDGTLYSYTLPKQTRSDMEMPYGD